MWRLILRSALVFVAVAIGLAWANPPMAEAQTLAQLCKPLKLAATARRPGSRYIAQALAIKAWSKKVKARYGKKWDNWKYARKPKTTCRRVTVNGLRTWRCEAKGYACLKRPLNPTIQAERPKIQPRVLQPRTLPSSPTRSAPVPSARRRAAQEPSASTARTLRRAKRRRRGIVSSPEPAPRAAPRGTARSRSAPEPATAARSTAAPPAARSAAPPRADGPAQVPLTRRQASAAEQDDAEWSAFRTTNCPCPRTVFYATNRSATGDTKPAKMFSGGRTDEMKYGRAIVTIPPSHEVGVIEVPGTLTRLFSSASPQHHIVIGSAVPLSAESFFDAIHDRAGVSNDNSIMVYIHGFNMTYANALKRAGQIVFDFNYRGTPIAFTWPSNGGLLGPLTYGSDREDALWSVRYLERFLLQLKEEMPDRKINIVAHSMGNFVLLNALRLIAFQKPDTTMFDNVVLAAPDFDADLFSKQIAGETEHLADNWIVYVSKHDRALQASTSVNEAPRLGLAPLTLVDGYQIIDASEIAVSSWNVTGSHDYFASQRAVIRDMVAALKGIKPRGRGLRRTQSAAGSYWQIR